MKAVPDQISRFVEAPYTSLGTDGFGRSDTREALRRHFEIDAEHIVVAVLSELAAIGAVKSEDVAAGDRSTASTPRRSTPAGRHRFPPEAQGDAPDSLSATHIAHRVSATLGRWPSISQVTPPQTRSSRPIRFALLVGMVLDQQIPLERAFSAPAVP